MMLKCQNTLLFSFGRRAVTLKTNKGTQVFILPFICTLFNLKYGASFSLIDKEGMTD